MEHQHEIVEVPPTEIRVMRDPKVVLAEAKKAAEALMEVVKQKKNPVFFNKTQYIEFEDWQTVAKFYGITAKVTRSEFIDYGGVKGFEATAQAIGPDGRVISEAHAMCLNDEENWSTRAKYEWRDVLDKDNKKIWVPASANKKGHYKGEKVKVGDVAVPLFQLKSMAQTRAAAKVLRNVLAWVVVLAGFAPTPAEEMDGKPDTEGQPQKPQEKAQEPVAAAEAQADQSKKAVVVDGVKMAAKRDGVCAWADCPAPEIKTGSNIVWDGKNKKSYHDICVA